MVHRELLAPAGMLTMRDALISRFDWFVHITKNSLQQG
jgi:hypothetical protein